MNARRSFFAAGLALLGFGRSVWAQLANPSAPGHPNAAAALGTLRYAPLTRPVTIPVSAVSTPWQPVAFTAESSLPRASTIARDALGGVEGRRVLISGVLFRNHTQLSALCVTCPHEQCQVDLVTDTERLVRMSPLRSGQAGDATHPLFECGCHFSVFDAAADGARISGESPRGLYRFRIGGIRDDSVEITEIEEAALSEV
jgi:nitrite reductase/ring-hydroxylating ferredoxin subunit